MNYAADTSAPTVTSTSPQNGATGVTMGTTVSATFSESLDASTVTTSTFELRTPANALVAGSVGYNAQTKTATFTPSAPLAASTTYTARLIGGTANPRIKDAAGNALAATYTFTFTAGSQPVFALGYNVIGGQNDTGDMNYMNGSRFTNGASAVTISSMSVYVRNVAAAPNNQFQVAVYSDAGGAPASLVAKSGTGTLMANAWSTLPITATLAANTSYWLMYNTNGDNNLAFDSSASIQAAYSSSNTPFGTWPASFGSAVFWPAKFSIYASR